MVRLTKPKSREQLRDEAADWVSRLRREPGATAELERWLAADPSHREAFDSVRRSFMRSGLLRESRLFRERRGLERTAPAEPRLAIAATFLALSLIPVGLIALRSLGLPPFERTELLMLSTLAGETKTVSLADGSSVTLSGASRVRLSLRRAARHATLEQGRVRFAIAAGAAPFFITAGPAELRTDGALVEVALAGSDVRTSVIRGHVALIGKEGAGDVAIDAGESVERTGSGVRKAPPSTGTARPAVGMLEFDAIPLGEAAAAVSRSSGPQIVFGDRAVAKLKVTGAFRDGDAAGLARALAETFRLRLEELSDGNFRLSTAAE